MLRVARDISIGDEELRFRFVRASGPGGQNVNKVATAAQLRFDVRASESLPEDVKRRLERLAGRRISGAGVLTIDARRYRTRERNRRDALERLAKLIRRAALPNGQHVPYITEFTLRQGQSIHLSDNCLHAIAEIQSQENPS